MRIIDPMFSRPSSRPRYGVLGQEFAERNQAAFFLASASTSTPIMSLSFIMRYSTPSILTSVPDHLPNRMRSPTLTSIAKEIELEDKFENMGAQMVREVASKTSDQAGDGTTTATVLAHAIVREGAKAVAAGMNPMDLKRGVDLAVEAVVADLQKNSKNVTSNE